MEVQVYKPLGMSMVQLVDQYRQEHNLYDRNICYTNRLDELAKGIVYLIITDHSDCVTDIGAIQQKHNSMNKTYRFYLITDLLTDTDEILGINEANDHDSIPFDQSTVTNAINSFPNEYSQKYHKFSSFRPVDAFDDKKKRQPMWFFSMRGIEIKNRPTKPVKIFDKKILGITKISGATLKEDIISRITKLKINDQDRNKMREVDILAQWKSYEFLSEYTLIHVELSVSSGFYIRQFARDLYELTNMKMTVIDIERTGIFE